MALDFYDIWWGMLALIVAKAKVKDYPDRAIIPISTIVPPMTMQQVEDWDGDSHNIPAKTPRHGDLAIDNKKNVYRFTPVVGGNEWVKVIDQDKKSDFSNTRHKTF